MTTKKWYQSKVIWTGIIAIVITVYNTVGTALASQCGIEGGICFNLPVIPEFVYGLLGAMGIYSRTVTNTEIK